MQSFNFNRPPEETPDCSAIGRKPDISIQTTFDERLFRKDLELTRAQHRSSSPADFRSFIQNSANPEPTECQWCHSKGPEAKGPRRLLGEIAFQLDRRILSHVFQGPRRLYGFNLFNIPAKIIEVSTHPLTGTVDKGYQLHLTQRYSDLMKQLSQLGYKTNLHPAFTEFIVNTFGILKDKTSDNIYMTDYNNPEFLRKMIMDTAPEKLQKDLLLVLDCLRNMAERDRRPLLHW